MSQNLPGDINGKYTGEDALQNPVIYVGADIADFSRCKIGLTTQLETLARERQGQTSNPGYFFFSTYNLLYAKVSRKELFDFEQHLHKKAGPPIEFFSTGKKSEWFNMNPVVADQMVSHYIINGFQFPFDVMDFDDGIPNLQFSELVRSAIIGNPFVSNENVAPEFIKYLFGNPDGKRPSRDSIDTFWGKYKATHYYDGDYYRVTDHVWKLIQNPNDCEGDFIWSFANSGDDVMGWMDRLVSIVGC